jgi:hypothetical protein
MFSTDQTHLRRYFATLGVAIAAGTLSLAGLFLKLQQELLVTQTTLATVTPTARDALLRRQEYLSFGTVVLPWFVRIGLLGGVGLSAYGMIGWAKRQRVIDEREDIGLRREQVELLQLTDTEKADKLDRDAKEAARESASAFSRTNQAIFANVRTEIVMIEQVLVEKLSEIYGPNDVLSSVVMQTPEGQRLEADVVVRPRKSGPTIFELKYASTPNGVMNRILNGLHQVVRAARLTNAEGVLVIVVSDDFTPMRIEQLNARARQMAAAEYRSVINVYVGRYSDFLALSATEFATQLGLEIPEK